MLADEAADRERTPLLMSQKIVQLLYKASSSLGREVYVGILDQFCRAFEDVAKEAISWLIYANDEVCGFCFHNSLFNCLLLAQVQRSSHRGSAEEWLDNRQPSRSTIGETALRGSSSFLADIRRQLGPRVLVNGSSCGYSS